MSQKVPRKELTFTSLPTHIISKILTFVSDSTAKEEIRLALTCKSWNAIFDPSCRIIMSTPGLPRTFLSSLTIGARTNEGTSGTSYMALNRHNNKFYHVKKKMVKVTSGLYYFMLREIVLLKNLSHPSIVPLKWVSVTKSEWTIVQPFASSSIADVLEDKIVLSPSLVKKWMIQLFDGLAYCHSKHIVHRNLKPKHIVLMGRTVETSDLQIADFSLSRTLPIINKKGQSVTNEVVTRWYRAPEIILGSKHYDYTIDVWSAGCIFAELLMGQALFPGASSIEVLFVIFQNLGTPTPAEWPELTTLPNYSFDKFPQFHCRSWKSIVPKSTTADREVLQACLTVNPARRASADKVLKLLKSTHSFSVSHPSQEFIYANSSKHIMERWKSISERLDYLLEMEERTYAPLRSTPKALERLIFSSKIDAFKSVRTFGVLSIYLVTYDLTRSRYLAMAIFDSIYYIRGLDHLEPNGKTLAQVIVAIIMLASKFIEGVVPTYNEMCRRLSISMDSAITREENEILQVLSLNMSFPTIVDYIDVLCTVRYGSVDDIPSQLKNAQSHFHCLAIVVLDELEVSFPLLSIAVALVRIFDCLNKCDFSNEDWERESTLNSFCETWGVMWDKNAETCLHRMLSVWFYIAEDVKNEDAPIGRCSIAKCRLGDMLNILFAGNNGQTSCAMWFPAMTKVKEHLLKEHLLS
eukprot:gene4944-5427_t